MAAAVAPVTKGGLGESAERGHAHGGEQEEAGRPGVEGQWRDGNGCDGECHGGCGYDELLHRA